MVSDVLGGNARKTTACFWWMALYLALALTCESLLLAYRGDREFGGVLGLLPVLPLVAGAFHAARFSRSREAFLCYGCLGGLLLFPALLLLPFQSRLLTSGWLFVLDVTGCVGAIVVVGFLARYLAIMRSALDRKRHVAVPSIPGDSNVKSMTPGSPPVTVISFSCTPNTSCHALIV